VRVVDTSLQKRGESAAHQVRHSKALHVGVRVGLVSYGVVHLLIAWLALQLAWTPQNESANSTGALRQLAGGTLGTVLLWVVAIGLVCLVVWQLGEAIWGHQHEEGKKRLVKRLTSAARAVVYGALALSAYRFATGEASGGSSADSMTATLMKQTGGQILVGLVGAAIVALGVALVVRGIKASFTHHLLPQATSGNGGGTVVRLGQAGYIAKGVSFAIIGGLVLWAAWTHDADRAGGLDVALQSLLDQPYGGWLVSAVAVGLGCFGAYCFAWARYPRE
jgi:hypothetical protein